MPVRSKVGDLEHIYTLDEVGSLIWEHIDGRTSVGEIVQAVRRRYDVAVEVAEKDVVDFVRSLEEAGLVSSVQRPGGEERS